MNATQRNFVINRAVNLMAQKLIDMNASMLQYNQELNVSITLTAEEIYDALYTGTLKLKPFNENMRVACSYGGYVNYYFDVEALLIAKKEAAVAKGYIPQLKGNTSYTLKDPMTQRVKMKGNTNFKEVLDKVEEYQAKLDTIATQLVLGDSEDALAILAKLEAM